MFAWIADNVPTIIALSGVLAVIGAALFSLLKDKKRGGGVCTGNCASCRMACSAGKNKN